MQPAYLPFNETQRLEALLELHILDTPADPQFDSFLAVVAESLNVPIATFTLIDEERQWHKAMVGLPARFQESPRASSLCAHVILAPDETLVVEDARSDARMKASPLVSGPPFIRFYAGHAILDESGFAVGALEIIDHSPRTLSDEDRTMLARFSRHASSLLRVHKLSYALRMQREVDGLTGLGNRLAFNRILEDAVARAKTDIAASLVGGKVVEGKLPEGLALLSVDIDGFKKVNDVHGHGFGDAILKDVARRLRNAIRGSDRLLRLGSAEFAILMAGPFLVGEPEATAQRIHAAFVTPFEMDDLTLQLNLSIGVALYGEQADTPVMLLQQAHRALADAKQAGPGQIRTTRDGAAGNLRSDRRMEEDLRNAIETEGFSIYWQPIVDLRREELHSYEALARWNRPDHGPVAPSTFIQVAERGDLMMAIDKVILRKACRAAASWTDTTGVSVNISPEWFLAGHLPDIVADTMRETSLDPSRLRIEITEGSLIRDFSRALKDIEALKAIGVQVTLDDFGFGLSSLSYLTEFPFDIIKLDGSFARHLRDNSRAIAVAQAAIELGHKLGIKVCAEGVEELWHLEFLEQQGCDLAQGYLFGRPSPIPQVPGRWGKAKSAGSTIAAA
ncbi:MULTISPECIES: putative bifunctional diguanylate cyclase/phosphodiesterase [Lichenihabitans]|uniref:putative bifunctional diguanylate cyclase/phosphodiesterase n=1 Tax=Lichenihabitans TaxID=2723776 RepID=UPI001035C08D|nr:MULTISPECIES: EAL domain-containing protein [Lichenihabitans]UDL93530.1 EAL domain-containing protein [Lichenihabitans sp. PAMC28606]